MNKIVQLICKYPFWMYALFFFSLFIQYPLSDSLPGHSDTILNLSIFNDSFNRIIAFFQNENIGRAYYPEVFYEAFTELYWGHVLIFLPFKIMGLDDIWAYYIFISIIYTLNGLSVFYFFKYFKFSDYTSLLGGFLFSASAFAISQIEFLNGIPYFLFFLSLMIFFKYLDHKKLKYLYLSSILIGIQFYFSIYITIYFVAICASIFIYHYLKNKATLIPFKLLFLSVIIGLFIIAPYIYIMIKYGFVNKGYSVIDFSNVNQFSLHWTDLIRPLSSHTFYRDVFPDILNNSFRIVSHGFLGFAFILLTILGIKDISKENKPLFFILLIIGIVFSAGPYLYDGDIKIPAPLYLFYKDLGFGGAMRIASRAYSLIIFAAIISILSLFDKIDAKGIRNIGITIFLILFFLENIPQKFAQNHYAKHLIVPISMNEYLAQKNNKYVILTLPSSLFSGMKFRDDGMSEHSREELYLYWQTKHKKNTVNGIGSYMSYNRKHVDDMIHKNQWEDLQDKYQVSSIIFLKKYIIDKSEGNQLKTLKMDSNLKLILEDKQTAIFEFKASKEIYTP